MRAALESTLLNSCKKSRFSFHCGQRGICGNHSECSVGGLLEEMVHVTQNILFHIPFCTEEVLLGEACDCEAVKSIQ